MEMNIKVTGKTWDYDCGISVSYNIDFGDDRSWRNVATADDVFMDEGVFLGLIDELFDNMKAKAKEEVLEWKRQLAEERKGILQENGTP